MRKAILLTVIAVWLIAVGVLLGFEYGRDCTEASSDAVVQKVAEELECEAVPEISGELPELEIRQVNSVEYEANETLSEEQSQAEQKPAEKQVTVLESSTLEETGEEEQEEKSSIKFVSYKDKDKLGTRSSKTTSVKDEDFNYKKVHKRMMATAYCLCKKCCGKSPSHPLYGVTASGYKITEGQDEKVIAVDPKVIPLGTKVYVESINDTSWEYGYADALDTGGAIKGNHIDLYMDSHQTALEWGVRYVNVYILE